VVASNTGAKIAIKVLFWNRNAVTQKRAKIAIKVLFWNRNAVTQKRKEK